MRLTKRDRQSFVRAIMNDVPDIDYPSQAQKLFSAWFATVLPQKIAGIYTDSKYSGVLRLVWVGHEDFRGVGIVLNRYQLCGDYFEGMPSGLRERLVSINDAALDQRHVRTELEERITSAINTCYTLKEAKERLPELVKYLPADRTPVKTHNVPVLTNIVNDLVKAGWPNNKNQGEQDGSGS